MSGQPDPAVGLYDPRVTPPEPEDFELCDSCENPYEPHSSWCEVSPSKGYLAMRAYHDAAEARDRGETNVEPECPVCSALYPNHERGCSELPEFEPSYRTTPTDFQLGGRYYDKDD